MLNDENDEADEPKNAWEKVELVLRLAQPDPPSVITDAALELLMNHRDMFGITTTTEVRDVSINAVYAACLYAYELHYPPRATERFRDLLLIVPTTTTAGRNGSSGGSGRTRGKSSSSSRKKKTEPSVGVVNSELVDAWVTVLRYLATVSSSSSSSSSLPRKQSGSTRVRSGVHTAPRVISTLDEVRSQLEAVDTLLKPRSSSSRIQVHIPSPSLLSTLKEESKEERKVRAVSNGGGGGSGARGSEIKRKKKKEEDVKEKEKEKKKEPTQIDRFLIVRKLGSGSFGVVYEAIDPEQKDIEKVNVALKVIPIYTSAEQTYGLNYEHVAEISAQKHLSRHPNVVPILEVVRTTTGDSAKLILVMPLAKSNLEHALKMAPLDMDVTKWSAKDCERFEQRLQWASQIACGLRHLHHERFTHRDMKPENILIAQDGTAQIADYGLVRSSLSVVPSRYGRGPNFIYTLWWRAPELLAYDYNYTAAIDWWAYGWIFFQMLTDSRPLPSLEDNKNEHVREYIRENMGWPIGFKRVLQKSYLQTTAEKDLSLYEVEEKKEQDLLLEWLAVPQKGRDQLLRNILSEDLYDRVKAHYQSYRPTCHRKSSNSSSSSSSSSSNRSGGGTGGKSGRKGKREEKKKEDNEDGEEEEEEGLELWKNIEYALAGLLQVDPTVRSDRGLGPLLARFPCLVPEQKGLVGVSTRNTFHEFAPYVKPHTMALATAVWDHLNANTPSDEVKPENMYLQEKGLWRMAVVSLAAKDLEDVYPQMSGKLTAPMLRRVNELEPLVLQRVDGDMWQGMLRDQVGYGEPEPVPSLTRSKTTTTPPRRRSLRSS